MAKEGRRRNSRSRGGFILGLLIGLAVGAALAVLFAPPVDESAQASEDGMPVLKRGQDRFALLVAQLRERYGAAIELGRDAYQQAKDEVMRYNKTASGS